MISLLRRCLLGHDLRARATRASLQLHPVSPEVHFLTCLDNLFCSSGPGTPGGGSCWLLALLKNSMVYCLGEVAQCRAVLVPRKNHVVESGPSTCTLGQRVVPLKQVKEYSGVQKSSN